MKSLLYPKELSLVTRGHRDLRDQATSLRDQASRDQATSLTYQASNHRGQASLTTSRGSLMCQASVQSDLSNPSINLTHHLMALIEAMVAWEGLLVRSTINRITVGE